MNKISRFTLTPNFSPVINIVKFVFSLVCFMTFSISAMAQDTLLTSIGPPDIAKKVDISGELSIHIADDFDQKIVEHFYFLEVQDSDVVYELEIEKHEAKKLKPKQKIRIKGKKTSDKKIKVEEIIYMEIGGGKSGGGGGGKNGGFLGKRSTVVILINLLDAQHTASNDVIANVMWGPENSVRDVYLDNSNDALDFTPSTVHGPYTVPYSSAGGCQYRTWSDAVNTLAKADGVSLNGDHLVYFLPPGNGCSFGGVATLGGNQSWLASPNVFATIHELGHNLDMAHSGSDPENDRTINAQYGDNSGMMGASYNLTYANPLRAEHLGYLSNSAITELSTTPSISNYTLSPLVLGQETPANAQVLKIPAKDGGYFYFSVRNDYGYDVNLNSSYRTGLSVHRGDAATPRNTTAYIKTLSDGESFIDELSGITVTQTASAADNSWVNFDVQIVPTFDSAQPSFNISAYGGGFRTYAKQFEATQHGVTITNNDAVGTPATTWTLSFTNLRGLLTGVISEPTVTLAAGESKTLLLSVNINESPDATASFKVDLKDLDGNSPVHFDERDYGYITVNSLLGEKPLPPTNLDASTYKSKGKLRLRINWTASPSPDIQRYEVMFDGEPLPSRFSSSSGTAVDLNASSYASGTYSVVVATRNNDGQVSEPSIPVTVVIP